MTRTNSLLVVTALVVAAACGPRPAYMGPRYTMNVFSEDTMPASVTVAVTGGMQVQLNGAGYYTIGRQPVVMTPATMVVFGQGTATISAVDSTQLISLVPPGTHPDSTDRVVVTGRMLRVTRAQGDTSFKLDVTRR